MHACQECEASGGAVDSIYKAFASMCVTRSIAELPALASQIHYIQARHFAPQRFQPAHAFPLFTQAHGLLNNLKVSIHAVLALSIWHYTMLFKLLSWPEHLHSCVHVLCSTRMSSTFVNDIFTTSTCMTVLPSQI